MQIWHRDSLKWLSVLLQPSFFFFLLIIHILRWRPALNLEPVVWWMCFSFHFFCFVILYHVLIRFIVQLIVHSLSVTHHSYVTTHYSSHLLYYVLLPLASTLIFKVKMLLLSFLFSFVMYNLYVKGLIHSFCTCRVNIAEPYYCMWGVCYFGHLHLLWAKPAYLLLVLILLNIASGYIWHELHCKHLLFPLLDPGLVKTDGFVSQYLDEWVISCSGHNSMLNFQC